ncbi:MAG: preprotein translocase subunit SecA [Candidatus Scalindua rubra]|uniref:Preprotein translocase subunit SecA n=1 Tax=Candidatus Scalindua rubra TaxID=1872076 RepID=A0A1E3X5J5_9BACT|nr:MAG: preprotein translocase subunit SecA [Candidatus Scalindua rubra]
MKKFKNLSDRYKLFGYEITNEPDFMDKEFGITPEIRVLIQDLYYEVMEEKRGTINKLLKIIKRYPQVPQFKNYLTVAYNLSGNTKKAYECNNWTLKEHPDYVFAKINLAAQYFEQKEYDKIPEVLGDLMEIQALYPDRKVFHVSEVMAFNKLAVIYFSTIGNLEAAESRFKVMEEIDEEHPDTYKALQYLLPERMKAGIERDKEEERTKRKVKTRAYDKSIQTNKKPEFNHPEVWQLYENGMRINHQVIKKILYLPRATLINDLETILEDIVRRYEHFKSKVDENGWVEEEQTFPIHAIFLLTELNATESLDKILQLLRQDEKLLEFWLGDFLTEDVWRTIYQLGNDQLEKLKQFVLEPNIYTFARSGICAAVVQIVFHEPERKSQIVKWVKDVLTYLLKNKDDEVLIDSDFNAFIICDIIQLKAKELLPLVGTLFDNGLVSIGICGDFQDVEKEIISSLERDYYKHKLFNIYDRYTNVLTTWAGYNEEEKEGEEKADDELNDYDFSAFKQEESIRSETKAGRNNPCPCGSGKKYKKCCWNE